MTSNRRTTRTVQAIDTEAALPLVAAVYEALYGEPLPKGSTVAEQAVVVAWNKAAWDGAPDVATICTEGVGEWLTNENTLPLWVYVGMNQTRVPLGLNRLPLRAQPIDFENHVRRFGDRLESNWALWEALIVKAEKYGVPQHLQHLTTTTPKGA